MKKKLFITGMLAIVAAFGLVVAGCDDGGDSDTTTQTPSVTVSTLAGDGTSGNADGTGTAAKFNGPYGVAVDSAGNVYVADTNNHRIRKITQ